MVSAHFWWPYSATKLGGRWDYWNPNVSPRLGWTASLSCFFYISIRGRETPNESLVQKHDLSNCTVAFPVSFVLFRPCISLLKCFLWLSDCVIQCWQCWQCFLVKTVVWLWDVCCQSATGKIRVGKIWATARDQCANSSRASAAWERCVILSIREMDMTSVQYVMDSN